MNPEWAIVLVTAIYCFLTLLILWANCLSIKAIKEQLKEIKRQFDETNRAFVTAHFEIVRNGLMTICVSNQGKMVAMDVRVKIKYTNFEIRSSGLSEKLEELSKATFPLGVGQSWYFYLDVTNSLKEMIGQSMAVHITYKDANKSYDDTTSLEFNEHFGPLLYRSTMQDMLNEVKEGVAALNKLPEAIKRYYEE